jgi:hypothetical protein
MRLNTRGIENVLECAKTYNLRVFSPSTIAVFGYVQCSAVQGAPRMTARERVE